MQIRENMRFIKLVILICFIILLYILINQNSDNPQLITKDVSDILPVLRQSPLTNEINETYAKRTYQFYFQHDAMELKYEIFKYPSVDESKENYFTIKNEYPELKIVNLGNDGFGVENDKQFSLVVFRTLNVITKVELDGNYTSLDQTITYAKKIRID